MKKRFAVWALAVVCLALACAAAALAKETYALKQDLEFQPGDVRTLQVMFYGHGGTQTLTVADKSVIAAVWDGLGKMEVRPSADSQPGVDGGSLEYAFTLADNKIWRYREAGQILTRPDGKTKSYEVLKDYTNGYMLFDDLISIPRLRAKLNGDSVKVFQKSFSYGGNMKSGGPEIPDDLWFEDDLYLPEGGPNVCKLTFGVVKPDAVSATLYMENESKREALGHGEPLTVNRDEIALPDTRGKYYLVLDAKFAAGTVKYLLEFQVSDLPAFFDSIQYGNDADGVTVTRTDVGLALTETGQNRKFVDFIEALKLEQMAGTQSEQTLDALPTADLPLQKPFSLTFRHQGEQAVFDFRGGAVTYTYGGKSLRYAVRNPERLEVIYQPLTVDTVDEENMLDYMLRGFLSKDVARFGDVFALAPEDVQALTVYVEEPDRFTAYDVTELAGKGKKGLCGLESMAMAKPALESDLYWPRRFFLSFELTMKDGTVYRTGERLSVNGKPAEWYFVSGDSGVARQLIAGRKGEVTQRETGIAAIRSIDDDGKITYVSPQK